MAHISQLDSGRHRVVIRHKEHYASRSFRTREEADAWAAQEEDLYYRRKNCDVIVGTSALQSLAHLQPLPSLDDLRKAATPRVVGGVYFLFQDDEIVYVGQSGILFKRLADHVYSSSYGKEFNRYVVLPCDSAVRRAIEKHYIQTLRPKYNLNGFKITG